MFAKVLIVGGTGSLGTAIIDQWKDLSDQFATYSRSEEKIWQLKQKFPKTQCFMGDVNDYPAVLRVLQQFSPTTIIVAAALKHIDIALENPIHCINTNIKGLQHVIDAVKEIEYSKGNASPILRIVYVSTDKACSPINIYGMSKGIGEQMVLQQAKSLSARLTAVRYGNVINSSGSIIPVFHKQAQNSKSMHFTVTDAQMTRFMITMPEAIQLIRDAMHSNDSGKIFIPLIKSMKIMDLAELFHEKYTSKTVKIIGIRPGEKIHELLFAEHEKPFISLKKVANNREILMLDSVPTSKSSSSNVLPMNEYSSGNGQFLVTQEELRVLLQGFI